LTTSPKTTINHKNQKLKKKSYKWYTKRLEETHLLEVRRTDLLFFDSLLHLYT